MSHSIHNSGLHRPFGIRVVQRMCRQFNSFIQMKRQLFCCASVVYMH